MDKEKEITEKDLHAAIGAEVVDFLEIHREEIVKKALEKLKRVKQETAPET